MADDLKIRVPVELDTSKVKDDIPKLNNVLANDNKAHAKIIYSSPHNHFTISFKSSSACS